MAEKDIKTDAETTDTTVEAGGEKPTENAGISVEQFNAMMAKMDTLCDDNAQLRANQSKSLAAIEALKTKVAATEAPKKTGAPVWTAAKNFITTVMYKGNEYKVKFRKGFVTRNEILVKELEEGAQVSRTTIDNVIDDPVAMLNIFTSESKNLLAGKAPAGMLEIVNAPEEAANATC